MKAKTILVTSLLVISLLLAGCGSKKAAENTVNLPAISGDAAQSAEAEAQTPQNAYPVALSDSDTLESALTYPVEGSATYDADMRAYIEQILNGTMTIEDLAGKNDTELRDILIKAAEGRLELTDGALEEAIKRIKQQ